MEYVDYLVEHDHLSGVDAIEASGWANERREELEMRQEEREDTLPGQDQMVLKMLREVVMLLEQVVLLVKVVLGSFVLAAIAAVVLYLNN